MKFADIKYRVGGMEGTDCRQELYETLEELIRFEADFATLCREVASLSVDHNIKSFALSPEFDRMMDARGIELPEIP